MNIHDIADLCGVSVATISRVINNSASVNGQTREKVFRVMREAGYVPNAFASGYGRNAMRIVGILCRDVMSLYYAKAVSLLAENLRRRGFHTLLCSTGNDLESKKKYLASMLDSRVDAVILVGSAYRENRDSSHIRAAASQTPVFFINAYIQIPNVYCVFCDEKEAIHSAVREMAGAGMRRILYLHDMDVWAWAGSQKLAGYRAAAGECGLDADQGLVRYVKTDIDAARQAVEELIDGGFEFDGVIASEDMLAIGALKATIARKRKVPVVGFNNSSITRCCSPELSSIDNMLDTLCPMAVDMLARHFDGEKISSKVAVSAELVERETFRTQRQGGAEEKRQAGTQAGRQADGEGKRQGGAQEGRQAGAQEGQRAGGERKRQGGA
ncbi:MAG: LacI family transcriptional regulator, partial [Clostridiales bacterium]|nr:LacI family transcriptional regulator [Clostridiales bacterium]